MRKIISFFILVLIFSCEKSDNIDPAANVQIKSITSIPIDSEAFTVIDYFKYNLEGRLIEIATSNEDTTLHTYYNYYDNYIVMQVPTMLPRKDTLYINQDGLVIKLVMGGISEFAYEYDSEGFLLLEGYTISNSNIIERFNEYTYDGYSHTEHMKYNYYDTENSMYYDEELPYHNGNDNIGIYFWGKQNKNLLKNIEVPKSGMFKEFAYKFDKYNRVSEMEITIWGEKKFVKKVEYYEQN